RVGALSRDVDALKTDVSLAKEMAATAKAQAEAAVSRLDARVGALSRDVDALKTDVSLAKEMAATAKAQADLARREVRELAAECRRDRELFLRKIEDILADVKIREEKIKPEKVELKVTVPYKMIYTVQKGDSLWSIAARPDVYNNPDKWRKIFEANRETLITPETLYPGQKLIIPKE
ncbi:LysM peptidoglycan-binding domain-containing protein, partial [Candidatus Aerophobetes bacterium]|nr:LysM peptidoglycan-binding domain-containing protein [Candidatus Aerophobetes bacterium]